MTFIGRPPQAKTKDWLMDRVSPEPNSGCWLWLKATTPEGYGLFTGAKSQWGRRQVFAHRFSYELFKGDIPENFVIDHLCRTPICVNPAHLEAVPNGVNVRRGLHASIMAAKAATRTHCRNGHPVTRRSGGKKHVCQACQTDRNRRWKAKKV